MIRFVFDWLVYFVLSSCHVDLENQHDGANVHQSVAVAKVKFLQEKTVFNLAIYFPFVVVSVLILFGKVLDLLHHRVEIDYVHYCQERKQLDPNSIHSNVHVNRL